MIILSGIMKLSPEDLAAVTPAALEMIAASRQEEGCIEYEFAEVLGQPGAMRIWERWETSESLDAHAASDHMKVWRAAMSDVTVISRDLARYEGVDTIMPLP